MADITATENIISEYTGRKMLYFEATPITTNDVILFSISETPVMAIVQNSTGNVNIDGFTMQAGQLTITEAGLTAQTLKGFVIY